MSTPIIQPSFGSGELSPSLFARVDLAKYRAGAAVMRNMFVDYRGGASTRPGTKFVCQAGDSSQRVRLIPFVFSTQQTYVLEFGHQYMRVITGGAQVLNADFSVFEIETPYAGVDLALLKYAQSADVLTICHPGYPPMDLSRTGNAAWALTPISFRVTVAPPFGVSGIPRVGLGTTTYRYVITAVDARTGEESLPSQPGTIAGCAVMSQNGNEYTTVGWFPTAGIVLWHIYRQEEAPNGAADPNGLYGLVGSTSAATFEDHNGIPDFTKAPPSPADPFANGTILSIIITAGGAGYGPLTTVTVNDPTGAGFRGFPLIAGGVITGISIQSGGYNYTAPVLVFPDPSGGVGAVATPTATTTGPVFVGAINASYEGGNAADFGGSGNPGSGGNDGSSGSGLQG